MTAEPGPPTGTEAGPAPAAAGPAPVAPAPAGEPAGLARSQRTLDVATLVVLLLCGGLLLARLGHYALWDDEANTAIFADNLWHFGDTTAWDGRNLIAFREGLELTGLKNRVYPPAQYLYAAPFLGLLGRNALAARLPFALAALAGFVLWAWWLRRAKAPWHVRLVTALLVLGNVSLFLYSRQARYYGLCWALSLALVYLYVHRHESSRNRWLFTLGSVGLLSVHYLSYGATMVCLAVDYLLFELWRGRDRWAQRGLFLGAQVLGLLVIVGVFNPMGRKVTGYVPADWWGEKLRLFWWNLRDLNACEFFWTPMLGLALVAFALTRFKDWWLVRGALALVVYAFVASVLSPQPVGQAIVSDIRYMAATIPLGIALTARSLTAVPARPWWPARLAAVALAGFLAFSTTAWSWFQRTVGAPTGIPPRSTLLAFLGELRSPQRSAYAEVSAWLSENLPDGAKVFSAPDYSVFPLMFHAPQLQYMWLLRQDQRPQYPTLPEHLFKNLGLPDCLIGMGPGGLGLGGFAAQLTAQGIPFEPPVRLDVIGPDRTRPELFWRSFTTDAPGPGDGVFLFRRAGVHR